MHSFKYNLIKTALISCGVATAVAPAMAQDAAEEDVEVIQVTGIRASLQRAQAVKMTDTSIVEAISAEDIGKLPDVSIAESLSRLPGVTGQRKNGRSQILTIRGLSPDFTTTTLNGRQQVSASDNRAVEYDMYPSELLSGATVYKTPDASLTAQALGGTVDMQTIRPLDHGKRTFASSLRYEWNEEDAYNPDASNDGYRFFASYIDQYDDDRWGLAVGISIMDVPTQNAKFSNCCYSLNGNVSDDPTLGSLRFPEEAINTVQTITLERDTIMGVLEYAPTDSFKAALDLFYTDFTEDNITRGIQYPLASWGGGVPLVAGETVGNIATTGVIDNVTPVGRSDNLLRESDTTALGLNLEWIANDFWTYEFDISWSDNERTDAITETNFGIPISFGIKDTVGFGFNGERYVFEPTVDYTDRDIIKLAQPNGWGGGPTRPFGQHGFYKQPFSTDELTQIKGTAEYVMDSDWFNSLEFGVQWEDREKFRTSFPEDFLVLPNGAEFAELPDNSVLIDGLAPYGIPGFFGYNPLALVNSGFYERQADENLSINTRTWQVEEEAWIAYFMANINGYIGEIPMTGNVGLQYTRIDQFSTGTVSYTAFSESQGALPVSGGKDFDEWLPSLNLSFEVYDRQMLRFSYARVLSRPRMDELKASSEANLDESRIDSTDPGNSPWSGSGGNPQLDPWIADAYDLSYEWYFDEGYLAVAYFYKDLKSFILNEAQEADFSDLPVPQKQRTDDMGNPVFDPVTGDPVFLEPQIFVGGVSVPQNLQGGSIDGWEVSGALGFELFHENLEGFGLTLSASFTESDISDVGRDDGRLPGLSEDVYSGAFYYEREGFSARISMRKRSEYLGEVANFAANREFNVFLEETLWDAQLSYEWQEGSMEGLTVILSGSNLSDEPFISAEDGQKELVKIFEEYGATYSLGVSYKF